MDKLTRILSGDQIEDLKAVLDFARSNLQQLRAMKQAELQQIISLQQKIANLDCEEDEDAPSK